LKEIDKEERPESPGQLTKANIFGYAGHILGNSSEKLLIFD